MNIAQQAPASADTADLARRLVAILAPLAILVAARFRVLGPWTTPIWTRLTRTSRRLAGLLACIAQPRRRASRAGRPTTGPAPTRLPAPRAWLLHLLRHEAAVYTQRLDSLLCEPAAVAMLLASPAALRALRPFCRLLGVTLPPSLQPLRAPRVLRSGTRVGRNRACPSLASPPQAGASRPQPAASLLAPAASPLHPIARARPAPRVADGCHCADPASAPWWPFPRQANPPPCPS